MDTKVVWDGTDEDRARLEAENAGLYLVEVQNHLDGNFLIFSDAPRT